MATVPINEHFISRQGGSPLFLLVRLDIGQKNVFQSKKAHSLSNFLTKKQAIRHPSSTPQEIKVLNKTTATDKVHGKIEAI